MSLRANRVSDSRAPLLDPRRDESQKDVTNNSRIGDFFRYGIFSPPTVTYDPLLLLLNHHDREERDRLTEKWKDNKLQELNFVGVVSALLANVLTSTGSWPNLLPPGTTTPWFVRTCWFCGIVFGIASVLTAADQTIRLHRLSSHKNGLALMRHSLRSEKRDDDGSFRPRAIQVYTWQLSVLFLVGSALCLLLGLFLLVWSAMLEAVNGGKGFDENGYVAVAFTAVAVVTAAVFCGGQITLYAPIWEAEDVQDA